MITYRPFYRTVSSRRLTEYQLIYKHGFSSHILHRMKHGKSISTKTLNTLCTILDCGVEEILEYIEDEEDY